MSTIRGFNRFIDWRQWTQREFTLPLNNGEKVVIEHTSINPNKSAHIGHLRNSCIGDALVRMSKRAGYNVEVHNYIDDLGNQLADTVVGILKTPYRKEHSRFGDFCWDIYSRVNKEYEKNPELMEQRTKVLHSLEEGSENLWLFAASDAIAKVSSMNFQKLFENRTRELVQMLRSAFTFCCSIQRAKKGYTGCWTRELVQMRAMRGSLLLPILLLFQGEVQFAR